MKKMIVLGMILILGRAAYGGEKPKGPERFIIEGRVMDEKTGRGIEGAYIGVAGLFEMKRSTPVYVTDMETFEEDALKKDWIVKEIEKNYGKIEEGTKVKFIYKRSKDITYGAPEGTYRIDVSTWDIEDISEYEFNIYEQYGAGMEYDADCLIRRWDKEESRVMILSGRAKTDEEGRFRIEEMYAPEKDVLVGSAFAEQVSKHHNKTLSLLMQEGEIRKCVGCAIQIYNPGYMIKETGVYSEKSAKSRNVLEKLEYSQKHKKGEYVYLGNNMLGKIKEVKGYELLHHQVPGPRSVERFEIYTGIIPEIKDIEIKLEAGRDKEKYFNELKKVAFSTENDFTLERAWSVQGGRASENEYYDLRRALFDEIRKEEEEREAAKPAGSYGKEDINREEETFGIIKSYAPKAEEKKDETEDPEVVIEEYVPEVIIEGKWGSGEGEFGKQIDPYVERSGIVYQPGSLAVNSRGDIYILDTVNNRIQKFNKEGQYNESIKIDSFKGKLECWEYKKIGAEHPVVTATPERPEGDFEYITPNYSPTEVLGINIVIDSEDNLYYYCIKGEKGEVWRIKDDEVKEKWEVEKGVGVLRWRDGQAYLRKSNKGYLNLNNFKEVKDIPMKNITRNNYHISIDTAAHAMTIVSSQKTTRIRLSEKLKIEESWIPDVFIFGDKIRVIGRIIGEEIYEYDLGGDLIGYKPAEGYEFFDDVKKYGEVRGGYIDNDGEYYVLLTGEQRVTVVRYELKPRTTGK